jgi:hypothetical protein
MCTSTLCYLDSTILDLQKRINKLERELMLRDINLSKEIREDYMYWIKILMRSDRIWNSNDSLKIKKGEEIEFTA